MADDGVDVEAVAALRKKRQFRKFTFRGLELERLLDLSHEELLGFVTARARRRMQRGLKRKPMALIKKLRKAKAGTCNKCSLVEEGPYYLLSMTVIVLFVTIQLLFFLYLSYHTTALLVNIPATGPLDRPAAVKTHLRDMIIVPEMIGSTVAVYNGKIFNVVDIKAEMVGYYLGEFSITYR